MYGAINILLWAFIMIANIAESQLVACYDGSFVLYDEQVQMRRLVRGSTYGLSERPFYEPHFAGDVYILSFQGNNYTVELTEEDLLAHEGTEGAIYDVLVAMGHAVWYEDHHGSMVKQITHDLKRRRQEVCFCNFLCVTVFNKVYDLKIIENCQLRHKYKIKKEKEKDTKKDLNMSGK